MSLSKSNSREIQRFVYYGDDPELDEDTAKLCARLTQLRSSGPVLHVTNFEKTFENPWSTR